MIRRVALLVAIAMVLLTLGRFPVAAESGNGIVDGVVKNGTPGGDNTAELEVKLTSYSNGAEVGSATAATDADGRFRFEGLAMESQYSYQCSVEYKSAQYFSDELTFAGGETTKSVEVTIYEPTTSDEAISVVATHMVIYTEEAPLRVVEQYTFFNWGDRTYVGSDDSSNGGKRTLVFSLPNGWTDLQPQLGLMTWPIPTTAEGFVDTMPVAPGSKTIAFSYNLRNKSGTLIFSKMINYPTYALDVVVQGDQIRLSSDQLAQGDPLTINGGQWAHLSYNPGPDQNLPLPRGTEVVVAVSGLPHSARTLKWVIAVLVVLAMGCVLLYFLVRRRLRRATTGVAGIGAHLERKREDLLRQIAQLDDDFEEGRVSKEAYQRMRSERKAELVRLMQQPKNGKHVGKKRG